MLFLYYKPSNNLLVHIVEELPSSILTNNFSWSLRWINLMPVPMVEVRTDVFPKIMKAMLLIQIRSGVILWNLNGSLE